MTIWISKLFRASNFLFCPEEWHMIHIPTDGIETLVDCSHNWRRNETRKPIDVRRLASLFIQSDGRCTMDAAPPLIAAVVLVVIFGLGVVPMLVAKRG